MKNTLQKIRILGFFLILLLPTIGFAQSNQYLHFDREDDFVLVPEAGQYVDGTSELSLTGWFYCDELAYGQGYMGFRAGSGDGEAYLIQLGEGKMECRLITDAGFHEVQAPANTAIPQVWQHIAWIYDGSQVSLYVNANLIGSTAASGNFTNPTVNFGIGKSLLGGFNFVYGGRADEVTVWDKALSQEDLEDMMENELVGDEENLQLYYKFNQGEPGGDNTGITHLIDAVGDGERDGELMNFALIGETSNFNGDLDPGFQAISFPQIPPHLTTDAPFELEATASSGLPVSFEILSGPATVEGSTITLDGTVGEVVVEASQEGDGTYDPAVPVVNSFMVLNSSTFVPVIDERDPLTGDVYVPNLGPIHLSAFCSIDYPELFHVASVQFDVDGENVEVTSYYNGHYEGWWTPPGYGSYSFNITSANNFGGVATKNVSITIVEEVSDMEVTAVEGVWCNPSVPVVVVEAELPSYMGAFDEIIGHLEVKCPDGGCGEWDRVASLDVQGHNGQWYEIIRYITPYGVPCTHDIDLTDFAYLLQGKIKVRVNSPTLDNGYEYYLDFEFKGGTPAHNYSSVTRIWNETYPFGDYEIMQPVDGYSFSFKDNAVAAKLKLVSTGHGWGDLNTSNAAEFYEATHNIWINGVETFEQHNWSACNPNPDACQPQNGTWFYDRAGWCPGSIAPWFDYDLSAYISNEDIEMDYVFYENYVDYCHPNHPDCVTGVTCDDCESGFNPHLVVASNLVVFSDEPIITGIEEHELQTNAMIELSPNPSQGMIEVSVITRKEDVNGLVNVYNLSGGLLEQFELTNIKTSYDLSAYPSGMYIVEIQANGIKENHKLVIQ